MPRGSRPTWTSALLDRGLAVCRWGRRATLTERCPHDPWIRTKALVETRIEHAVPTLAAIGRLAPQEKDLCHQRLIHEGENTELGAPGPRGRRQRTDRYRGPWVWNHLLSERPHRRQTSRTRHRLPSAPPLATRR
jgi:hypothetical protein